MKAKNILQEVFAGPLQPAVSHLLPFIYSSTWITEQWALYPGDICSFFIYTPLSGIFYKPLAPYSDSLPFDLHFHNFQTQFSK